MSNEESRFFLTFIGEYVQLTLKISAKTEAQTEDATVLEEGPIVLQGFLLDEDKKYYYLGGSPDHVTDAIKKVTVARVRIVEVRTKADDIFDAMETEGGIN